MDGNYVFNVIFPTTTRELESVHTFTIYPFYVSTLFITTGTTLQGIANAQLIGNMMFSGSAILENINRTSNNINKFRALFATFSGSSTLLGVGSSNPTVSS